MIVLQPQEFGTVTGALATLPYYDPIAWSVVEGRQEGTVAVDDRGSPRLVLIRGANRYCYLVGDCGLSPLSGLEALDVRRPGVTFCVEHPEWAEKLVAHFGDQAHVVEVLTHRLESKAADLSEWRSRVPSDCTVSRVDGALFDRIATEFSLVPKVLWLSGKRFVQEGMGYCVLRGDAIASICFTGFVGGGACDITVMTDERFRGRGYAGLVSAALVAEWTRSGCVPQWHTTADNGPSLAIAARLGFRRTGTFPIVEVNRG